MPTKSNSATKGNSRPRSTAARGRGQRLTLADRYKLLETHRQHPDWSYEKLAATVQVNPATARLICATASRSAAELMAAYAGPMLLLWRKAAQVAASRGDHRPTKDWLLHAGSIDPMPETQRSAGPSIVIVNTSLPGLPSAPTITIDGINAALPDAVGSLKPE